MSDRRRRGEDEFASENPWPDDDPNDYRWAQDLAREAREEERQSKQPAAPDAAAYPGDPYQPPSPRAPRVPPQASRGPAPRRGADPVAGHPSGPMPTVPAEPYGQGGRRAARPPSGQQPRPAPRRGADPVAGHPSGPMPTVPAEPYGQGGRRTGPPPSGQQPRPAPRRGADPAAGHPSGPMPTVPADSYDRDARRGGTPGGYPPERGGSSSGAHARPGGPASDDYRAADRGQSAGGRRRRAGRAGPDDRYPETPDPYASAPGRRSSPDDPRTQAPGRRRGDAPGQGRGRPDRYPEPPSGGRDRYPEAPDGYQGASPYDDPRGPRRGRGGSTGQDPYLGGPGQPAGQGRAGRDDYAGPGGQPPGGGSRDARDPYPGGPGQRGGRDDYAGPAGGRGGRPDGQDRRAGTGPQGRRPGSTGQYPGDQDAYQQAQMGAGPGDGYGDTGGDYPGDEGGGFFSGLRQDEPAGSRRGRGRGRGGGGGGGDWDDGRGPRKRRGGRIAGLSVIIVLLIIGTPLIVGGYFLYSAYEAHYNPPNYSGSGTGNVTFQVISGDTAFSVADRLVTDGVVASARALEIAAEKTNSGSGLEPGFYRLHKHMSAAAAWALLISPKARVQLTVTIPEGLRVTQILPLLAKDSGISLSDYQAAIKNTAALGLPSYARNNPEGYLYPATYQIEPNATATSVLKGMVNSFNQEAAGVSLPQAARAVHLSEAQVIVVASLAQAEAGKDSDMPKIAEVIYNRLAQGMDLGFDSTVLFALNTYGIAASNQQLQVNSPYNTYTHKGLPPGPIDSPGNTAIQAALHPARGGYLYFVDVNPKIKDTVFTSSPTVFQQLKNELARNTGQ